MLVEVKSHHMVFTQILDLTLLVYQLAFLVFQLFLGNDPVVVDPLPLFLEVGQKLLLLLVGLF